MTIGDRIKTLRKEKGLTQKELAEKLGVSASMVGQYETNVRKPKLETLEKFASSLGVSISEIADIEVMTLNRIAELRKQNNLSQVELSKKLGIAQNTLSQYENGLRAPSSRIILLLSDMFNVSPNYLLGKPEVDLQKRYTMQDVTKILQETNINRVNLYLRNGWRLLHVGEDRTIGYDGAGQSTITYSLGWFESPRSHSASQLPEDYSNEDEGERWSHYKICRDRKTGEEICVGYDEPENEPPDIIDCYND